MKSNVNILAFQNPKGYTDVSQLEEEIVGTTSAVKFIMGVAFALVYFTMLDSIDKIKTASWYANTPSDRRMMKSSRPGTSVCRCAP